MKMKKLLALLLGAAMIFSLAGFAPSEDAKKAYTAASKKTGKLTALKTEIDLDVGFSLDGTTISAKLNMRALERMNNDKYEMAMVNTISMFGAQEKMSMYFKDGWIYQSSLEGDFKELAPAEEVPTETGTMGFGGALSVYMSDATIRPSGDGWIVSYKVDANQLNKFFSEMPDMMEEFGDFDPASMRITSVSGTATIDKDGYLTGEKFKVSATDKTEGVPIKYSITVSTKYGRLEKGTAIPFPANLGSFREMAAGSQDAA